MSERPRPQSPNILFHVFNRGNARQSIFREDGDFCLYLNLLQRYKIKYDIRLYQFVLMSNHVHLALEPTKAFSLSKFMQGLTIAYTKYFNAKYRSVGHVWQARFHSIPIEAESYYLRCARYIELNPVRAGIVSHPEAYAWSSYQHSIGGESPSWLDTHPLVSSHIPSKFNYRLFVEAEIQKAREHTSETFSRLPIYGTSEFVKSHSDLRYL